jgi:hypothetical protein
MDLISSGGWIRPMSSMNWRSDVVHQRLHPGAYRLKAGQPQQVERCGSQCGHRPSAITAVEVGVFMGLGDPPVTNGRAQSCHVHLEQEVAER